MREIKWAQGGGAGIKPLYHGQHFRFAGPLRNAKYQGPFKWFIANLAKAFREPLLETGIITRRDVIRMADTRLFADLVYILDRGFSTTKPEDIDTLYAEYDREFPGEDLLRETVTSAVADWYKSRYFEFDQLNRKHIFYTFAAAIVESTNPGSVTRHLDAKGLAIVDKAATLGPTLFALDSDLIASEEDGEVERVYPEFYEACRSQTNVSEQKVARFAYLLAAIRAA